jgi:hypothetical protein
MVLGKKPGNAGSTALRLFAEKPISDLPGCEKSGRLKMAKK